MVAGLNSGSHHGAGGKLRVGKTHGLNQLVITRDGGKYFCCNCYLMKKLYLVDVPFRSRYETLHEIEPFLLLDIYGHLFIITNS